MAPKLSIRKNQNSLRLNIVSNNFYLHQGSTCWRDNDCKDFVTGFSLSGSSISPGTGTLFYLNYSEIGDENFDDILESAKAKQGVTDDSMLNIDSLKKNLLNLNFQKSTGQLENTSAIKKARRKIASLKTSFNQQRGKQDA